MRRARRRPNRHQGSANLNRPRKVGTAGPSVGGLSPNRVAPKAPKPVAPPVAPRPAAPVGPPPPVNHDPFAVQAGDSATTIAGIGLAGANYQNALAYGTQARTNLLQQAGVEEYTDPATGRQFRLNAAGNPYSTAGRLGVQFQQRKRGTNTSLGAAGMLFDGGAGRAVMRDQRAEGEATTDLLNSVRSGIGQIEQGQQGAFSDAMASILGFRGADATNDAYNIKPPAPPTPAQQRKASTKQKAKATKGENAAVRAARKAAKKKGKHR